MRSIKQIKNLKGKTILLRVDFNVPIKNGKVKDDFRIKMALPTIRFLQEKNAKIILITHLGKGGETLKPVFRALNKYIKAKFIPEIFGLEALRAVKNMKNRDVIFFENLRNDKREKECSDIFTRNLARYADIYVNEAFSVSHRKDSSIILLPKLLPAFVGFQLEKEVKNLSLAFKKPKRPFLFILGGAKFSTKMPLIKKYLKLSDYVFVGGALADDFLKAKGYEVGKSLIDDKDYDLKKILKNRKLILPSDVVVKSKGLFINKKVNEVGKNDVILDIGRETVKNLLPIIKKSKLILWNGPLGKYEVLNGGSTKKILRFVSKARAESIIGGGDTVEIISDMKIENKFTFVSTGGGATLDFLASGTLPGIKAL